MFFRLRNRCYRYTTFQLWCGFSISIGNSTGNATEPWILVQMHMANERYQQNSHKWQTWPPLTVGLPVTSERYWVSFQVTRLLHKVTVSQCDHFFCCHICICCLKLHQADYKIEEFFVLFCILTSIWWGALSSNVFTICTVYLSLGCRGYFGVSNVAFVTIWCR